MMVSAPRLREDVQQHRGVDCKDNILDGGVIKDWVVATQIFLEFSSLFGEMIQFDEHIFQMG